MKIQRLIGLTFIFLLLLNSLTLKAQTVMQLQSGKATSIRGLSVVDDHVAWISGSRGTIAITLDGGKTWNWSQVKGFEKSDFRDIEAFSDREAVIMASGTPAVILKTMDAGLTWQMKYKNTDTAYFLDAMDFSDKKHGFILGDPINNKFLLLETRDGGETWGTFKNSPIALPNEASFAASGTCIRVDKLITIVTGGGSSRLLSSPLNGMKWTINELPLTNGKASMGAFSVAYGKNQIITVGGDYANNKRTDSVACIIQGKTLTTSNKGAMGFQSCVEHISGDIFLSTGTSGTNLSRDGGKNWGKIDDASYNVCRKAKHGNLVLLAGDGGKIGAFKL